MIALAGPAATEALGGRIARALTGYRTGLAVGLAGELGAGKTALARATLHALGYRGAVVSPSYTLVEPYAVGPRTFYHMDLYRLGDPGELEFLGVREIDAGTDWLFVEWAARGIGFLPALDLTITLEYAHPGRRAQLSAHSKRGWCFIAWLNDDT